MKEVKIEKLPSLKCPRCQSTHGYLSKKIFYCFGCGKFLDPKTNKYKDFDRGITVRTHGRLPDSDNNYDSDNPRKIGGGPVLKELRF